MKAIRRKWFTPLILCAATISAFTSSFAQTPNKASNTPEVKEFTLITTSDVQIGGPWFVASRKGFFAEEGLTKVNVQSVSAIPTIYPQIRNGRSTGLRQRRTAYAHFGCWWSGGQSCRDLF